MLANLIALLTVWRGAVLDWLNAKLSAILHRSIHLEHYGFTAYAACEAFSMHHAVYWVAVWLFVTGLAVEAYIHLFGGEIG